jgi:hypothetical protein
MSNKVIYAIYNDDDILMDAVKKTRLAHHHIEEVFTLSSSRIGQSQGIAPTRLAMCVHIWLYWNYLCNVMMNYIMIQDCPRYWGKPSFSYVQNISFCSKLCLKMTVFFAAHLMVLTFI